MRAYDHDLKDKFSATSVRVHCSTEPHPLKVAVTRMVTQVPFKRKQKEVEEKKRQRPLYIIYIYSMMIKLNA